jgi:hypothetical protein
VKAVPFIVAIASRLNAPLVAHATTSHAATAATATAIVAMAIAIAADIATVVGETVETAAIIATAGSSFDLIHSIDLTALLALQKNRERLSLIQQGTRKRIAPTIYAVAHSAVSCMVGAILLRVPWSFAQYRTRHRFFLGATSSAVLFMLYLSTNDIHPRQGGSYL